MPVACALGDQELRELRDRMYDLATLAAGAYRDAPSTIILGIEGVSESERTAVEERAAIHEFEGNLSRPQAEALALTAHLQSESPHQP